VTEIEDELPAIGQRVRAVAPAPRSEREAEAPRFAPRGHRERVSGGDRGERAAGAQIRPVESPRGAARPDPEREVHPVNGQEDRFAPTLVSERDERRQASRGLSGHGDDAERQGHGKGFGRDSQDLARVLPAVGKIGPHVDDIRGRPVLGLERPPGREPHAGRHEGGGE